MQTHASVCSQERSKAWGCGGWGWGGSRGGDNIKSKETTDLNHVPLKFTF